MTGGYSVIDHASMVSDTVRIEGYAEALRRLVKPGAIVLEIGTGCGILALYACELGAAKVYAVEAEASFFLAREVIGQSRHAAKVELCHGMSTDVTLPERADLVLGDLHGVLPFYRGNIPSMIDARTRHLAAGGTLLPTRDVLRVAPVECPELYDPYFGAYASRPLGVDLSPAYAYAENQWTKRTKEAVRLLAPESRWGEVDYRAVTSPDARGEVSFTVGEPGTVHGLLVWFDSELGDVVTLSNHPDKPLLAYGSAFFPLSKPRAMQPGDTLDARLRANFVDGDYVWQWSTTLRGAGGEVLCRFDQTTFMGQPVDAARLKTKAASHCPTVTPEVELERFILERIDGVSSNQELARALLTRFPERFSSERAALDRVVDTVIRTRVSTARFERAVREA
jgi:protein arginine N-methyltransferase 1